MNELTTNKYWDSNWEKNKKLLFRPAEDILHYDQALLFERLLKKDRTKSLLDVGCAPGRYLKYFSDAFGYQLTGIDFSRSGVEFTKTFCARYKIDSDIIYANFLEHRFDTKYDIVFSAGFIEHFSDPSLVVGKMIDLTKPGGTVLTTIPNFYGLLGLSRKFFNPDIYAKHNPLSIEELGRIYTSFALERVEIGVLGNFVIPSPHPRGYVTRAISILSSLPNRFLEICYRKGLFRIRSTFFSPQYYAYAVLKK